MAHLRITPESLVFEHLGAEKKDWTRAARELSNRFFDSNAGLMAPKTFLFSKDFFAATTVYLANSTLGQANASGDLDCIRLLTLRAVIEFVRYTRPARLLSHISTLPDQFPGDKLHRWLVKFAQKTLKHAATSTVMIYEALGQWPADASVAPVAALPAPTPAPLLPVLPPAKAAKLWTTDDLKKWQDKPVTLKTPLIRLIGNDPKTLYKHAVAATKRLLSPVRNGMDLVTFNLCQQVLAGFSVVLMLQEMETKTPKTFAGLTDYLVDPRWEDVKQIACSLRQGISLLSADDAALVKKLMDKLLAEDEGAIALYQTAINLLTEAVTGRSVASQMAHRVQVFAPADIRAALNHLASQQKEIRASGERVLENAQMDNGYRLIPNARRAYQRLEAAKSRFENLVAPICRLQSDLTLAAASDPKAFHITPLLLLGEPGIGKTYLASELAEALGVQWDKMSAGGAQGNFQLTGSNSSYRGAQVGTLLSLMARSEHASPVFVIDEVDKIADGSYPVTPVLLDLLEPNTAQRMKDDFLRLEYDASRMITILTANSLAGIPPALLSRVEVFTVPRPGIPQRRRIIGELAKRLRAQTRSRIHLDRDQVARLAERTDIDLRRTTRTVKEAFAQALQHHANVARMDIPRGATPYGFGA